MALAPNGLGVGQGFFHVLRGSYEYVTDSNLLPTAGIEIKFYSTTDKFIALVGTTYDSAPHIKLKVKLDKIGGLKTFNFSLSRIVDIPFFNEMRTRIYIDGQHWFTGELTYQPNQDQREPVLEFTGKGFYSYTDKFKLNVVWQNKTPQEIVEDIVENYLADNTPIKYNPDQIDLPSTNIVKLEANDKSIEKVLKRILEIVNENYQTTQYEMGVDKDLQFYFRPLSNELKAGFFEGYQYQNPDVETSIDDLVNTVNIFRTIEDSDQVEDVATVQDTESQGLYGERVQNITIPDFFDTTTAQRIGNAIIDRYKDPIISVSLSDLEVQTQPYDFGKYALNNRVDDYSRIITECDDKSLWTKSSANITLTDESDIAHTGRRSIKVDILADTDGQYIEFELNNSLMFPNDLVFYLRQDVRDDIFEILVYDEDGNIIEPHTNILLGEDDAILLGEDGSVLVSETLSDGFDVEIIGLFIKQSFDISELTNIKKIRLYFITESARTFYIDRFEIATQTYLQRQLFLDNITYNFDTSTFLVDAEFGEKFENLIQGIKEIKDKEADLFGIFEKS